MGLQGIELLQLAAVLGSGLVAGFINTVAGGGSLLTLPALIFLGLPAVEANATNRIGVLLQSGVAAETFRRQGLLETRLGIWLLLPSIPGAILGAFLAVDIGEVLFRRLLAGVMILVLLALLRERRGGRAETASDPSLPFHIGSARAKPGEAHRARPAPTGSTQARPGARLLLGAGFFAIGFYAGFLQAGVGFLIIAALTGLARLDLVRTNALKVFILTFLQALSLAVFAAFVPVHWLWGLAMASGQVLGGWAGARWQVRSGEVWVRRVLVATILACCLKLLL